MYILKLLNAYAGKWQDLYTYVPVYAFINGSLTSHLRNITALRLTKLNAAQSTVERLIWMLNSLEEVYQVQLFVGWPLGRPNVLTVWSSACLAVWLFGRFGLCPRWVTIKWSITNFYFFYNFTKAEEEEESVAKDDEEATTAVLC